MFNFFKELRDAVKEGVAEANEELAEEKRREAAGEAMLPGDALEGTTEVEWFGTALGAPYRDIYIGAMRRRDPDDPALFLQVFALPDDERASYADLLKRDFDVVDADSARASVARFLAEMNNDIDPESGERLSTAYRQIHDHLVAIDALDSDVADIRDKGGFDARRIAVVQDLERRLGLGANGGDAFRIGVVSHIVCGACGVGYLSTEEALELVAPLAAHARSLYGNWSDYGAAYLAGEVAWGFSNIVARKIIDRTVATLVEHPASPWVAVPWEEGAP